MSITQSLPKISWEQQQALLELSLFYNPDPTAVFAKILQTVSQFFQDTFAQINLIEGENVTFHAVRNAPTFLEGNRTVPLEYVFCSNTYKKEAPVLIQNAIADPDYSDAVPVQFGMTRYCGVPIFDNKLNVIGTLCFTDAKSEVLVEAPDIQFMSLLAMRAAAEIDRERMIEDRLSLERRAADALSIVNAQLIESAEQKAQFINAVLHDLRQPVTSMRTVFYLLKDASENQESVECLDMLNSLLDNLNGMVDDLNAYQDAAALERSMTFEEIKPVEIVKECVIACEPEIKQKRLNLQMQLDADSFTVFGDRSKLVRIINNLLSNAIKFTDSGFINISLSNWENNWKLEVEDSGIGIADAEQDRIFKEFYRSSSVNGRDGTGFGLGLSIVKRYCEVWNAQIEVDSQVGKGSHFTVTFPKKA